MRRLCAALVAATVLGSLLLLPRLSETADASEWWCWDDPVLVLNGRVVHIYTGVKTAALQRVTLAEIEITVPAGVDAKLTASNAPRFPQTATLRRAGTVGADGSVPVSARVIVNGHGHFDVGLKMSQPGGATTVTYGQSNQPLVNTIVLPGKTAVAGKK